METEYCSKCGILHDHGDGVCLGCELIKENKQLTLALTDFLALVKRSGAMGEWSILAEEHSKLIK